MSGSSEKRTVRVQVVMTASEVEAVDDWGFAHKIRSRSDVFRKLVLAGLETLKRSEAAAEQPGGAAGHAKPST